MNASARARPSAGVFASGDRELDDRLAEHAAQPGLLGDLRDLFLEVIHVRVGRRAGLDHLERASRVPARTNSGVTVFASAGKMYFCSHSISARSSARPR